MAATEMLADEEAMMFLGRAMGESQEMKSAKEEALRSLLKDLNALDGQCGLVARRSSITDPHTSVLSFADDSPQPNVLVFLMRDNKVMVGPNLDVATGNEILRRSVEVPLTYNAYTKKLEGAVIEVPGKAPALWPRRSPLACVLEKALEVSRTVAA